MVSILVGGEEFSADEELAFVFGRTDADGVVGLDRNDMGISAVAGSVQMDWGVWWVVNQSRKRPLKIELPDSPSRMALEPGHRHAIVTERINVLVEGAIYVHSLEIVAPSVYAAGLRSAAGHLSSGTLSDPLVSLTDHERIALVALCEGFLAPFPHRRTTPNTYADSARLLGQSWTPDAVRKAVERVKTRFAAKAGTYFQGIRANDELAAYLVANRIIVAADLVRLPGRRH